VFFIKLGSKKRGHKPTLALVKLNVVRMFSLVAFVVFFSIRLRVSSSCTSTICTCEANHIYQSYASIWAKLCAALTSSVVSLPSIRVAR
jgi:hypothetical protein